MYYATIEKHDRTQMSPHFDPNDTRSTQSTSVHKVHLSTFSSRTCCIDNARRQHLRERQDLLDITSVMSVVYVTTATKMKLRFRTFEQFCNMSLLDFKKMTTLDDLNTMTNFDIFSLMTSRMRTKEQSSMQFFTTHPHDINWRYMNKLLRN